MLRKQNIITAIQQPLHILSLRKTKSTDMLTQSFPEQNVSDNFQSQLEF